jgi:hypothetical protein
MLLPPSMRAGRKTKCSLASQAKLLGILTIVLAGLLTTACNLLESGSSSSAPQSLTVTGNLPQAFVGKTYSAVLNVTGGSGPYRFSLQAGSLPEGVKLSPTGTLSGVVQKSGTYNFTIGVTSQTPNAQGVKDFVLKAASRSSSVTVQILPASPLDLQSGAKQQFSAKVTGSSDKAVTWSTSAGTISASGLFTAPVVTQNTTAIVTATSAADPTQGTSALVTISAVPAIQVTISPAPSITLQSGAQQQFLATVSGASNASVTWSASAGTISSNGLFTAPTVSQNTSLTVMATSVADPTKSASTSVAVDTPATVKVAVSPSSSALRSAAQQQFTATVSGTSNTAVTWSTSAGTISPSGLLTAPTVSQNTNLTVTAISSADPTRTASASVTVLAPSPTSSGPDNRYCGPGNVANFGAATDGPASLPTQCFYTAISSTPSPGAVINVPAGADLQTAVNNASCGETLLLQAGGVWTTGQIMFPAKACDDGHWITIRTSTPDSALPPEGTRLTPCYAGVSSLPGRPALNCTATDNVLAKIEFNGTNSGPLMFLNGANHYRFIGLEITKQTAGTYVNALAAATVGSSFDHVIFDRTWFHGYATDETTRGVQLDGSSYVAVIDSFFTDFHCIVMGKCTDAQAVSGGNGSAPMGAYKVVNNFLESSGENIIFGGGSATYVPTDIEIRRNHFFKPLTWKQGQPGFIGVTFSVKNHLELKNAQRILVEGNIMEDTWGGFSQAGFSVVVTPKDPGSCSVCEVTDVTYRYNTISHVGGGFQLANVLSGAGLAAVAGERYSIHDVTADDISSTKYNGNGVLVQVNTQLSSSAPLLQNVSIDHITAFANATLLNVGGNLSPKMTNFVFTNNIVTAGVYPVWSTGGGTANCAYNDVPITTISSCFSPVTFTGNVIVGQPTNYTSAMWPAGNSFASSTSQVGFVNFNNGIGGDYSLSNSSPYAGASPGADVTAIQEEIAGVY